MSDPSDSPVLVTGVTGQDGHYLTRLLLARGRDVVAGVRRPDGKAAAELREELPGLRCVELDLARPGTIVRSVGDLRPSRIFHLGGVSSVARSWGDPAGTIQVNTQGTLALLDAVRRESPDSRLVFAGSGDCYDHEAARETGITVSTPLRCTNPYSISKAAAIQFVQSYRAEFGLHASVAVLMNHTSPRRPLPFVERMIVHDAVRVARGEARALTIGSLDTRRDWSWAEDIVEGIAMLGESARPGDYIFASGRARTTGDWVRLVFGRLGVEPAGRVIEDAGQKHSGDRPHTFGNIEATREALGWSPKTSFEAMVERMVEAELARPGAEAV